MGVVRVDNVLVSPSIVKNLISVRKLTRDNNVSIEFDPYGFSINDLPTRTVMLRCESSGELYPYPQPRNLALSTSAKTVDLWHHRLGHPGNNSLIQVLQSFDFQCKYVISRLFMPAIPVKWANMLGCHFPTQIQFPISLSNLFIRMFGRLPFTVITATNIILFYWMTSLTAFGHFPFAINLMFQRCSVLSMHTSARNLACHG